MDEKRFVELLDLNNDKLLKIMNANNDKLLHTMEENNNKLLQIMEVKNNKLKQEIFEEMDRRFEIVNKRFDEIDKRFEEVDKRFEKIDEKFKKVNEKIIDSNFYFEENYGRKIDIIFEKLQLEDEKKDVKIKEFEEFKSQNNAKLLSHDVRITKLEKVVNSN